MVQETSNYKWWMLSLVVLTNMFVVAIPAMGISVLSKEISQDLRLTLVQVGLVWGIGSLPGILTILIGGAIVDKIGPKPILILGTFLAGLVGASRGLAGGFTSLLAISLLLGALAPFVSMSGIKTCGQWFPPRQLGLANGIISMGMALGFLLGSLFSASLLSPLIGGWRNVLIGYGVIAALLSIPWIIARVPPGRRMADEQPLSIRKTVLHVAGLKNIWLLGLTLFGVGGCVQGMLGYLPLYLRNLGWQPLSADSALTAFHTISMICVLPIALWSDRHGSRKQLLMVAAGMVAIGSGLLSVADGWVVWAAVLTAGFVRDAFMAIFITMVIETDGVGAAFAGTAVGFTMAISGIGNFLAPPLGNSFSAVTASAPFALWSVMAVLGIVSLSFVSPRKQTSLDVVVSASV